MTNTTKKPWVPVLTYKQNHDTKPKFIAPNSWLEKLTMIYDNFLFFLQLLASCIKSYSHVRNNHKFDSMLVNSYMKEMYKKTTENTYPLTLVVPRFLHGRRVMWNNNGTANFQTSETKPITISTEHTFFFIIQFLFFFSFHKIIQF